MTCAQPRLNLPDRGSLTWTYPALETCNFSRRTVADRVYSSFRVHAVRGCGYGCNITCLGCSRAGCYRGRLFRHEARKHLESIDVIHLKLPPPNCSGGSGALTITLCRRQVRA